MKQSNMTKSLLLMMMATVGVKSQGEISRQEVELSDPEQKLDGRSETRTTSNGEQHKKTTVSPEAKFNF